MKTYADTSFLVSYYLQDSHSAEADRRMDIHPTLLLTPFHRAEMGNVVYQYVFRGIITSAKAQLVWEDFQADVRNGLWLLSEFPPNAWESTIALARRHGPTLGVRTLDSLHVASALALGAGHFWTFDDRQARLAEAVGLNVAAGSPTKRPSGL